MGKSREVINIFLFALENIFTFPFFSKGISLKWGKIEFILILRKTRPLAYVIIVLPILIPK